MQTKAHDAVNAATQRFHSGILCEYLQGKSSYFFQEPRVDNTFRVCFAEMNSIFILFIYL